MTVNKRLPTTQAKAMFTPEFLGEVFTYDDVAGAVIWRTRPRSHFVSESAWKRWNTVYAGTEAGSTCNSHGFKQISLKNQIVLAHWVVFTLVKGYAPKRSIKHRDGNKLNNRIENLVEVGSEG